jgi:hypothetical protein
MPIGVCPKCQSRFAYDANCGDIIHDCCSGDETLDNEDVKLKGNWEDYTGSGSVAKSITNVGGLANELQGTEAQVRDKKAYFGGFTSRGNPVQTTRTRSHLEFIEVRKNE